MDPRRKPFRRRSHGVIAWLLCFVVSAAASANNSETIAVPPLPVPATLADAQASPVARILFAKLVRTYGKFTWSGQQDAAELPFIQKTTGHKPAIVAGDFMDYSPSRVAHGAAPKGYTESMIELGAAGHILAFSWHWNAPTHLHDTAGQPWRSGFYTKATAFDVGAALANTNSTEYSLILRDIDAIALQLKKVAAADIPVLWRPLHESEGAWFWWGAKGAEPFKQLWRLLFSRLTVHHGLHNLIWVLSSEDPAWYPGDDVVDIIGADAYPKDRGDTLKPRWDALKARFDGKKLIALTEFGGVPDIEQMRRSGVYWSWFVSWTGASGPASMPPEAVVRIYDSPVVVTLDKLPQPPKNLRLLKTRN